MITIYLKQYNMLYILITVGRNVFCPIIIKI